MRAAIKAVGGAAAIPIILGILGLIAQLSQYQFLGLPSEQSEANFMDLVKESETEGFLFLYHTVVDAGFGYIAENPYAIAGFVCVLAFFLSFYLLRKKKINAVIEPLFLLPVILVGSIIVLLRYDVPSRPFTAVLRSKSTTIEAFEVAPAFQSRARQMWTDIVCSRVANDADSRNLCGTTAMARYKQNLDGRYFFNVLLTLSMAILFMLLYLLRPDTNTRVLARNIGFVIVGVGVALDVIALPYVYSRSVRTTTFPLGYPKGTSADQIAYMIRTAKDEYFAYHLDSSDFDLINSPIVTTNSDGDDVLRLHLLEAFRAQSVLPPAQRPFHKERQP